VCESYINNRLDQEDYQVYKHLENLIVLATEGGEFHKELDYVTEFYGNDFDKHLLETQLLSFKSLFSDVNKENIGLKEIVNVIKSLPAARRAFLSQI